MTEVEKFWCTGCFHWVPDPYKSNIVPYGFTGPWCQMCLDYWDYLVGDEDDFDDDSVDDS